MIEFPDSSWRDYELLDSGEGEKLERFGSFVLARPEPKALWGRSLPLSEWNRLSHTRFKPGAGFGKAGKEDSGIWERLRRMDDQWWIRYQLAVPGPSSENSGRPWPLEREGPASGAQWEGRAKRRFSETGPGTAGGFDLRLGLTSFKHVGVFPEQAPNWDFIYRKCLSMEKPKVLNLFAYTGAASLAARAGGAEVTHLDSVRQVVTWARQNLEHTEAMSGSSGGDPPLSPGAQGLSQMSGIRWVVEDAMKFARREARRGNTYDGIILDPPAYGHGPDGEKWKLDECLFEMLRTVAQILAPHGFMVLNLYSNGYSAALGETLVREAFGIKKDSPAVITSGELALSDKFGKVLPLSIVVRLER